MTAPNTLLVVIGVIRPLTREAVAVGAQAEGWEPHHPALIRDYSGAWRQAGATNEADIVALQETVRRDLRPLLADHPCHVVPTVIVAALAPLTILVEIGHLLRTLGYAVRVLDHHRTGDTWAWPTMAPSLPVTAQWVPELPSVASTSTATIAIVASISGWVVLDEVRASLGQLPGHHVHVSIPSPQRGIIQAQETAADIARAIALELTRVRDRFPDHQAVALFLAIPSCVAVLLGFFLQDGFGRNLRVYENASQGTTRRYVPGGHFLSGSTRLQPAPRTTKRIARVIEQDFQRAITSLRHYLPRRSMTGWAQALIPAHMSPEVAEEVLPRREFRRFDQLDPEIIHRLSASVTDEVTEFEFVGSTATLRMSPALANAVARGFSGATRQMRLELAIQRNLYLQLFVLHEWSHVGQNLDGALATQVGQFPKALEDLDWLADSFALIGSLRHHGPLSLRDASLRTIATMLTGMVAFQPAPDTAAAQFMEVRRLNRHLIWLVQYARVAALPEHTPADRLVWDVLASKPNVDLRGLPPLLMSERVMVDLERGAHAPDLALGIAIDGRLLRVGQERTIDLKSCLQHLRRQDAAQALRALAGLHAPLRAG